MPPPHPQSFRPGWGDLRAAAISGAAVGKGKAYRSSTETIKRQTAQANFVKGECAQGPARIWVDKMEALGMKLT